MSLVRFHCHRPTPPQDARGRVLGRAAPHDGARVSWERGRRRTDLIVTDPAGLRLFLLEHGAPGALTGFLVPLARRLGMLDDHFQHRPAGAAGLPMLIDRGVPAPLRPALAAITGAEAAALPADTVRALSLARAAW